MLGLALFVAPWILSFTNVPEIATWIIAALVAVNAAAEPLALPGNRPPRDRGRIGTIDLIVPTRIRRSTLLPTATRPDTRG